MWVSERGTRIRVKIVAMAFDRRRNDVSMLTMYRSFHFGKSEEKSAPKREAQMYEHAHAQAHRITHSNW